MNLKEISETTKNIIEISAIIIGGIWAYYHFAATELAGLQSEIDIHTDFQWKKAIEPNYCYGNFEIKVSNAEDSHSTFEIVESKLQVFEINSEELKRNIFVNTNDLTNGKTPTFSKTFQKCKVDDKNCDNDFIYTYGPGKSRYEDFVFHFPRDDKSKKKIVIFRFSGKAVQLNSIFPDSELPPFLEEVWGHMCDLK